VQIGGTGHRMAAARLREMMREEVLRKRLLRYCHALSVQTAHTALANAKLKLDARLARWLLMCHDRLGCDEVPLTHDFLSIMLGVRRAGVTVSLHILEGQGARARHARADPHQRSRRARTDGGRLLRRARGGIRAAAGGLSPAHRPAHCIRITDLSIEST
jgi:hypothetical protein